jgi:hypothetical protein
MKIFALTAALVLVAAEGRNLKPTLKLKTKGLNVRGGDIAGVSPELAAKVGTTMLSANGVMMSLSPDKTGEMYGVQITPMTSWLAEGMGNTFLGIAVTSWCALNGVDTTKAIGFGMIPWLVGNTKTLLNDLPTKLGVPPAGMYFATALSALGVYATLGGTDFGEIVAKGLTYFWGLNGIAFALAPEAGGGAWGVAGDELVTFFMKNFGYFLLSASVLNAALLEGWEAPKAIGASFVVALISIIDNNFIAKNAAKFNMEMGPQYFWMALQAGVIACTML